MFPQNNTFAGTLKTTYCVLVMTTWLALLYLGLVPLLTRWCPDRSVETVRWSLCLIAVASDCKQTKWIKIKMTVSWDVLLRNVVEVYGRFRGAYCLCHQNNKQAPLKCQWTSTRLHCTIAHRTVIFILATVRTWNLTNTNEVRLQ
jgi:hypothetical protein